MNTNVYGFTEGSKDMKDLLGGKGANLCELTSHACSPFRIPVARLKSGRAALLERNHS